MNAVPEDDPRALELLRESAALAGAQEPDGAAARALEAWRGAAALAQAGEAPSLADLNAWQRRLAGEDAPPLPPGVELWRERLAAELAAWAALAPRIIPAELPHLPMPRPLLRRALRHPGAARLVAGQSLAYQGLCAACPVAAPLGRLLAGYAADFCGAPLPVFRAAEREALAAAERDEPAMRRLLARKLREAVRGRDGELLLLEPGQDLAAATLRYVGASGQKLLVEWHELIAAERGW
ncbi:MAG: hypothetical protein AB7N76_00325 [Planctomycetota bacterium]